MEAMLICSACDAAICLAEGVGKILGQEKSAIKNFVEEMNI